MKLLLFSGTHSRHVFVHEMLLEKFEVVGIVCMTREELVPEPDSAWALHDQKLFRKHFEDRFRIEKEEYGDLNHQIYSDRAPTIFVDHKSINSEKTLEFVKEVKADACFIFGTGLIKFPIIGAFRVITLVSWIGYFILAFLLSPASICRSHITSNCTRSRCR